MMKYLIALACCMFSVHAFSEECLGATEKQRVEEKILHINDDYLDYFYDDPIDNIFDCTIKRSKLAEYVCANKDIFQMFRLLTRVEAHQQASVTKQEPDLSFFNQLRTRWESQYESAGSSLYNLCYDIKDVTMSVGGGTTPYYSVFENPKFHYHINQHGFVLQGPDRYSIYLGKKCDAIDSSMKKGQWSYNSDTQLFHVTLNEGSKKQIVSDSTLINKLRMCEKKETKIKLGAKQFENILFSNSGASYEVSYNRHGAVLKDEQSNIIYIGKSCDILSPKYGPGTWGKANGGFIVSFEQISISFPRQELMIEKSGQCNL